MLLFSFAGDGGHMVADAGKLAADAVYFAAVGGKQIPKQKRANKMLLTVYDCTRRISYV